MQQGCRLAGMRGQHVTGPQGRQRLGMHGERVQRVRVHHGGRARGAHQQGLHECRRFRLAPDARPQHHPPALAQERQKLLKQCRAPPHVPRRAEGTGHDVRAVRLDVPAQAVRSGDADQPASGTQGGPGGQMRRARKPFRTAHDQNGPGGPLVPPRSGFRKSSGNGFRDHLIGSGMLPPRHGRNADGPDVQPARVRRGFRQDKAGLRRLEGHGGVGAHGDGARTPGQSGKAGRDIQRKNEGPLRQRVDPGHQPKLQRPEAAGKARAEYPVHDDVRAAPLADGSVGIYIPRRIAVFFGPARSRGKRHAATPGQPHMLPRHAPVGPQRPGMQHKHLGASVVQMPGKTSGIPAVVAAAHEQQDALARHMARFSRKHMQGLAGGVFHQQQFGQAQINGGPIPAGHFRRRGKRCEHTKTSRRPGCHKRTSGPFFLLSYGPESEGSSGPNEGR